MCGLARADNPENMLIVVFLRNKDTQRRILSYAGWRRPGGLVLFDLANSKEYSIMKRFVAICMALSLVTVFVGCDKKAEVKKTTTVSTPEGTTTKTDTSTIKTDKAP